MTSAMEHNGALVVSLDFELHWGMRDVVRTDGPYRRNFLGAREAVPRLLELFEAFDIAATWATVGMLFAKSRADLERFGPSARPRYDDARLDPYVEPVGDSEADDPFHYAPSLIAAVHAAPRQEIATHTFSHFYCREPGQDRAAFAADLQSAVTIAAADGVRLRSIVFPRNQHEPAYDRVLMEAGIIAYRGTQRAWMHRATRASEQTTVVRAARYADSLLPLGGRHDVDWTDLLEPSGLVNIPASFFVRPVTNDWRDRARFRRLTDAIERAARDGRVVHLWWHPHNFGVHLSANLDALRGVLDVFRRQKDRYGMRSLSMADVADHVLAQSALRRERPAATTRP